jgi:hypothetical protein
MAAGRWRIGTSHQKKINQIIRYTKIKMSKFSKKAASFGLIFATVAFTLSLSVAPVQALTIAETQAQIDTLLAQIQTMQAQLGAQGAGTTSYTFTKNLTLGTTDAEVKTLQQFLNANSYIVSTSGAGSIGSESTYFGTKTKAALIAFQTAKGLTAIGFFGPLTRATIASMSTTAPVATLPAGCTSAVGFSTTTGLSCATATPVTTFSAGCTSAVGLSSTTGLSCAGAVAAVGAPLTVMLASDTPVGGNIVIGSANNVVTKVVFTASSTADTTISGLMVKSFGTATLGANDIALVRILDVNGIQQGLSQVMVQGNANFVFTPAISIPKNTSKTLNIAVDMAIAGVATPSSTVKMGIEAATKIMGGATFTGTFPIVGNPYWEVAGGALGTVNVAAGAIVPANTAFIGAIGTVLGNFTVSAGTNEDITVTQFNVNRDPALSTVQDSDISNVRVLVAGVQNGTPTTFSSQRATINLTTPVAIVKGTSVSFQVLGDIASGALRTITLQANTSAVIGAGKTSGAGVAGPAANLTLAAANTVTIQAGIASVSVSTNSPQGTAASIVISSMPQVLGVYDLRAGGEELLLTDVGAQLVNTGVGVGTIGSFGIYDVNGALLSNQVNLTNTAGGVGTWSNGATNVGTRFTLNTLIPAGTVKQLVFKGTTNLVTVADSVSVTLINIANAPTNTRAIVSTGMSSSGQAGANNVTLASVLALPPVTINLAGTFGTAGVMTGDIATSKLDQTYLGPVSQAITGTIKVTANNEDQRLRNLVLTGVPVGFANMAAAVSSVALYDGSTQITDFVAPVGNTVTYATANVLVSTTFVKNTPKVLTIVANTLTPTVAHQVAGASFYWTIAAVAIDFQTTGVTSGVVAQHSAATASNFRTNLGAYNEGGTYLVRSNVLEVSKSADSPLGTVARGNLVTVAKFDLSSKGAGVNLGLSAITFTTPSLPAALTTSVTATGVLGDATMFRLYDVDNSAYISATSFLSTANKTIAFSGITAAAFPAVTYGQVRKLALVVDISNTALWPAGTSMNWAIQPSAAAVMPVVVGQVGAGAPNPAVGNPDLPTGITGTAQVAVAVAANTAGSIMHTGGGGAPFNPLTMGLYLLGAGAAGNVVTAGDVRLWIGPTAVTGAGFTQGSIVIAGNGDAGTALLAPQTTDAVGSVRKTGGAAAALVLGQDAVYFKGAAVVTLASVEAGDVRIVAGNVVTEALNWQGGVGFGGASYSIPGAANTVTVGQ